jgi:hypothetical protein
VMDNFPIYFVIPNEARDLYFATKCIPSLCSG